MMLKRFVTTSLVVGSLLLSSAKSDNCVEKKESHIRRIYKRSSIPSPICSGRFCERWSRWGGWGVPHDSFDYDYPIDYYGRFPRPPSFEHHMGIFTEMKIKLNITCGVETNVTLPLEYPDRQSCDYCKEISLEIKQLNGNILPKGSFGEFKDVTILRLVNLGIQYISSDAFEAQENCQEIYLSGNNISEILPGVFSRLNNLNTLDLSYNNIRDLNQFILNVSNDNSVVNLSHNQIDLVEEKTFKSNFEHISTLDLSFNEIINVNFDYVDKSISSLDVSHNHLTRISGCIYKIPKLVISYNKIRRIENLCLNESLSMNYLDISHNRISTLNSETFPDNFEIKVLLLQSNIIKNFSIGTFSNLMRLETLNLSSNSIDYLPVGSFENMGNLKTLDISNNNLKKINFYVLHSLNSLREFHIQDNMIGDFNYKDMIERFPKLQTIYLNNNNFSCDNLIEMIFHLEKNTVNIVYGTTKYTKNIHGIACFNKWIPKNRNEHAGKTERSIKFEVKAANNHKQITIFWTTIVILTLLLIILAFQTYIIHYKCQIRQFDDVEMI